MIVDAFAGPGGWDEGARELGITDIIGIEWDADACATATAAGHQRVRADIETYPTEPFAGKVTGLIMSPPCPDFSTAGKGAGRRAFLLASLDRQPGPPAATHARNPEPPLFGPELKPWVSMADALGWNGSVGFPRLDDLGNSPDGYRERDWRSTDEPAFNLTEKARSWVVRTGNNSHVTSRDGSRAGEGGVEVYERSVDEPAPTLDTKVGTAWKVIGVNTGRDWKAGGTRADAQVVPADEPAPTVDATGRWHALIEQSDEVADAIRLDVSDALILQSFRADYPLSGSRTSQFQQVGNAVPPALAAAVLAEVA